MNRPFIFEKSFFHIKKNKYFCTLNRNNFSIKMEQNNTRENTEMSGVITTTEAFIEKNKKTLIYAITGIIVVILAIFGISKWNANRNVKANEMMFAAEQYMAQGQFDIALNGNAEHAGLLEVADKYSCTKAGNRAKYAAALCYLHTEKYAEAIDMLKSYKGKDKLTPLFQEINLGNCELEQGNNKAAIKHYEKAIKNAENYDEILTYAMFLNGMAYSIDGNNDKANEMFKQIKQHPGCAEIRLAELYIGLTEAAE